MTNVSLNECREAFETWAISQGHTLPATINGQYCDVEVARHWETWQAAWYACAELDPNESVEVNFVDFGNDDGDRRSDCED